MLVSPPKVSVIIVAYRAQGVISDCIDSLLRQTYPKEKYEIIIVVDDNKTYDVVEKYLSTNTPRIHIEHRTKRGNIPRQEMSGFTYPMGKLSHSQILTVLHMSAGLRKYVKDLSIFPL